MMISLSHLTDIEMLAFLFLPYKAVCFLALIVICNTSYNFNGGRYYKRVFEEFFVATDANIGRNSSVTVHASEYHRFGWLLFLALRVHAFSRFRDLVTCTNGLISILVSCILMALSFSLLEFR